MARPLLSIVPLLFSATAAANPPVPPARVTGNVSTEHHTRRGAPLVNACRVTGNITPSGTKSPPGCLLSAGEEQFRVHVGYYEQDGATCVATGAWIDTAEGAACALVGPEGSTPLQVPAAFAREVGS